MSSGWQSSRPTLHRDTLPIAIYIFSGYGRVRERKPYVIGDEQIQMPIPVVVKETASRAPAWLVVPKASGLGYVGKRSIAVVAVTNADARRPSHRFQSGLLRHIGEGSVAVIFVEAIGRARWISLQTSSRQQENVDPSVVVVVDKRASTTGCLQNIFLAFNPAVDRGLAQPRSCRDIDEACVERTPRRRRPRHRFDGMSRDPLGHEPGRRRQKGRSKRKSHKVAAVNSDGQGRCDSKEVLSSTSL